MKRTVSTVLRRGGFGEFLYYTVYETVDPANEAVYGLNNSTAQDKCAHYAWEPYVAGVSKPRDSNYCSDIQFVTGDKINGPLHSNDTILMSGTPRFQGTVTTSDPACKPVNGVPRPATACYDRNGSASPQFDKGIAYRSEVDLPTSIGDLKKNVDPAQTDHAGVPLHGTDQDQVQRQHRRRPLDHDGVEPLVQEPVEPRVRGLPAVLAADACRCRTTTWSWCATCPRPRARRRPARAPRAPSATPCRRPTTTTRR